MNNTEAVSAGEKEKGCTATPTPFPKATPTAMAYIPFEQFSTIYAPEKALNIGTVFPDLDKPFLKEGAVK